MGRRGDGVTVSASPRLPISASPRPRVPASPRLRVSASPRLRVTPSPCLRVFDETIIFGNESQDRACKSPAFAIISLGRVCFSQFGLP